MGINVTESPDPVNASGWAQMSRRERAFAAWLQLRRGWTGDLTNLATYDMETDRVVVEYERFGTIIVGVVGRDAEETLARIEERFGPEARRRAEEAIA